MGAGSHRVTIWLVVVLLVGMLIKHAAPVYSGGEYVGCYRDTSDRDLDGPRAPDDGSGATIQKCIDFCRNAGALFAGAQGGYACLCGDTYGKHGVLPEGDCYIACPGDATEICGGNWANSIFQLTVGNCGDLNCTQWEACDYSGTVEQRRCLAMNYCTGQNSSGCYHGFRCCGHGIDSCMCEAPKMIDTMGQCKDCDCPWNERCSVPHGECICGDHQVRDQHGNCVDCDPELSCPQCSHDRTCAINPGDKSSSCECLPGSVERDGECVWCKPCPNGCNRDQDCITPGFSEPYCGCPPGTDEVDGKCVECLRCPDCGPERKCVARDGCARCECPHSTYDTPWGCIPLITCPQCDFDDHEVCVLPATGSPHCECAEGYVRDGHHRCVPCEQDECDSNSDCATTGAICYDGQCQCPPGWQIHDGECVPDGYIGGSCKLGGCHGTRTHCSRHGVCECDQDSHREPIWACIPKKERYFW